MLLTNVFQKYWLTVLRIHELLFKLTEFCIHFQVHDIQVSEQVHNISSESIRIIKMLLLVSE